MAGVLEHHACGVVSWVGRVKDDGLVRQEAGGSGRERVAGWVRGCSDGSRLRAGEDVIGEGGDSVMVGGAIRCAVMSERRRAGS